MYKIICIKDFEEHGVLLFKKNVEYEIKYNDVHIHILYNNGCNSLTFNKYSFFGKNIAHKYFITNKELRKLKLKKLNA